MTKVALRINEQGRLEGLTPADSRAYNRFKGKLQKLQPGETISFEHRFPRSGAFHRRHFAMLGLVFDNQEQFAYPDDFRSWVEVGAGHCQFVPGPDGRMVALPKSVSYTNLDDVEFSEHHAKVVSFLRSTAATRFLWPLINDTQAGQAMESLLQEFER
ncbi:DUF1367 family protein [Paenalcaligenes niemegkensis]|uniref:DUF1367 family protein n=1 Tax=Paenalcaligenes niemegkensis TaxID=2895469 RepID=UPI001EE7E9F3|nr:DUF1367 family protein [Paenalcaligenes niemegkensis]MCQ9618367.1 DUF1367 family protein [Paenalcaligenes niemegkensis]